MKFLVTNIINLISRNYIRILVSFVVVFFSSTFFMIDSIINLLDSGMGIWGLNNIASHITYLIVGLSSISLICVCIFFFFLLILTTKLDIKNFFLLALTSVLLIVFSIIVNYIDLLIISKQTISLAEYLKNILTHLSPNKFIGIASNLIPGFYTDNHFVILNILPKFLILSISVYLSCLIIAKSVFKINNFLNKNLPIINLSIIFLSIVFLVHFFYLFSTNEFYYYSLLNSKFKLFISILPILLLQCYWIKNVRNSEFISGLLSFIIIPFIAISIYFDLTTFIYRDSIPSTWSSVIPSYLDISILSITLFFPLAAFTLTVLIVKKISLQ